MTRRMRFAGVKFLLFGVVFVAGMGLVVHSLWNALAPELFHLPAITFWQAVGLLVLSRVLFGGLGGRGHGWRKPRFARGWNNLRPQERERFRRALGNWHPDEHTDYDTERA